MKFYFTSNANRSVKTPTKTFVFEVIDRFAGAWRGVLALSNKEDIEIMDNIVGTLGIKEIPEEEYNEYVKKKNPVSKRSVVHSPPKDVARVAQKIGLVVEEKSSAASSPTSDELPEGEDALQIGAAPFVDPLDEGTKKTRKRK